MLRNLVLAVLAWAGCVLGVFATPAQAIPLGFSCITNNDLDDCAIGAAQLSVSVTDPGGGQVKFLFTNAGPSASSITDIYFDDGTLLGIASVTNGPGTSFSAGASPPNLPGGNNASPPFEVTAGFLADSNPPAQPNGVNPNEYVEIVFNLVEDEGGFAEVLSELTDGRLRIGIHVQGYEGGGSESFVNVPLPEPGTLVLVSMGTALLASRRLR